MESTVDTNGSTRTTERSKEKTRHKKHSKKRSKSRKRDKDEDTTTNPPEKLNSKERVVEFVQSLNMDLSEGEESDSSMDSTDLAELYLKYSQGRIPESSKDNKGPSENSNATMKDDTYTRITTDRPDIEKESENSHIDIRDKKDSPTDAKLDHRNNTANSETESTTSAQYQQTTEPNNHLNASLQVDKTKDHLKVPKQTKRHQTDQTHVLPDARFPPQTPSDNMSLAPCIQQEEEVNVQFSPKVTVFDPEGSWSQQQLRLALMRLEGDQDMHFSPAVEPTTQMQQDLSTDQSLVSALRWQLTLHRTAFREEILRLGRELRAFKMLCAKEVKRCVKSTDTQKSQMENEIKQLNKELEKRRMDVCYEQQLAMLERGGRLLDQESSLTKLEEELESRQKEAVLRQDAISEFEQEVEEAEKYLDRRMELTKLKEQEVQDLNQELTALAENMKEQKQNPLDDGPDAEEKKKKAALNWNLVTTSMLDEKVLLKSALKKAQSDQAQSENNLSKFKLKVAELERQSQKKDQHIQDLERQLSMALLQVSRIGGRRANQSSQLPVIGDTNSSLGDGSGLITPDSSTSSLQYYTSGHKKRPLQKTYSYPTARLDSGLEFRRKPSIKQNYGSSEHGPTSQTCAVM